jgi:O-antigen ligase
MGVYLSYSRGALAAALIGAILILALVPTRPQLRAAIVCLAGGLVTSASAAALPGVASLEGTPSQLDRDGAIMLAILLLVSAAAAVVAARTARAERAGSASVASVPFASRLPLVAGAAVLLCVVGLIVGGLLEDSDTEAAGARASRLASVSSLRYEYWQVGVQAFADHPLGGLGAGGFRVYWRQHRDVDAGVTEVHSLELELAAELGLPGLALLLALLAGVGLAARQALRRGAPLAVAGVAGCTVWLLHASIDWDWQVPAVTLPAILLAGGLLAECELPADPVGEPLLVGEPEPALEPALRV